MPALAVVLPQAETLYTKQEMVRIATETALRYGLNVEKFLKVVGCESDNWKQKARGDYRNGVPTSFGLAQFHHPVRDWGMTIEQADDPVYALERMAKAWSQGKQGKWSCYWM